MPCQCRNYGHWCDFNLLVHITFCYSSFIYLVTGENFGIVSHCLRNRMKPRILILERILFILLVRSCLLLRIFRFEVLIHFLTLVHSVLELFDLVLSEGRREMIGFKLSISTSEHEVEGNSHRWTNGNLKRFHSNAM